MDLYGFIDTWIHNYYFHFQYFVHPSLTSLVRIGTFNLKDDSVDEIVETFYAFLDNVIQSYATLDLTKAGQIFIKVLGPQHMRAIRVRQGNLNDDLNVINRGQPEGDEYVLPEMYNEKYFINVPRDFLDKNGEKCFKDHCLTLSIILGKNIFWAVNILYSPVWRAEGAEISILDM